MRKRRVDAGVEHAEAIGIRNQHVEMLMRNYCSYAQVEPWAGGGIGMVEAMTGLPIGMRIVRCPHAKHASMASMNVESLALNFYAQNCINCSHRRPVRLPNISGLHAEAQAIAKAEAELQERRQQEWEAAAKKRRDVRALLRDPNDSLRERIVDLLDEIDQDGSPNAAERLVLIAKDAPSRFDARIRSALESLAAVGGPYRTEADLRVRAILDPSDQKVAADALIALGRDEASEHAATLIEERLTTAEPEIAAQAVPALCRLASRPHHFLGVPRAALRPEPLIKLYRISPQGVLDGLVRMFSQPEKETRISAAQAAERLIALDADLGPKLIPSMLASLQLPDDGYEDGYSARYVSNAMALALLMRPTEIDAALQIAMKAADADTAEAIFGAYEAVPRVAERKKVPTSEAVRLAAKRALAVLLDPASPMINEAIEVIDSIAEDFPDALEGNEDLLLGAAALLESECNKPAASAIIDLGWNPLKGMEAASKRLALGRGVQSIGDAVRALAKRGPDKIFDRLSKTFSAVRDREDSKHLRALLLKALGGVAANPAWLNKALPHIYTGMTDSASIVRAAAAEVYGDLLDWHGPTLPPLIHDTFLLLLADRYVIVHTSAARVVRRKTLPPRLSVPVFMQFAGWCQAYANDGGKNSDFVKDCLFELVARAKELGVVDRIAELAMKTVAGMALKDALDVLPWLKIPAAGAHPVVLECATRALKDPELFEYHADDLLAVLDMLPPSALEVIGEDLATAAELAHETFRWVVALEFMERLDRCGKRDLAAATMTKIQERLPNTTENESLKTRLRLIESALSMETALAAGDRRTALVHAAAWTKDCKKVHEEDAARF